ncbi:outer membrane beta-barrel protein [Vibrio cyclitrophicus]|nr:hypothetical protein [Vibrio cyclitrophicus]UPR46636.1 outer membrane beta-barrel protein [Vibrio cyclitrophicus]
MKKLVLAALTIASVTGITSTSAIAANEMYVLGGVGMDSGDVGGQFTLGSQIAQSNWYVESTLLAISINDKSGFLDHNNDPITRNEDFDSLIVSLAPMYKHNLNEAFAIYGKLGAFYTHSDTKLTYNTSKGDEIHKGSNSNLGVIYGIGAEYKSLKPLFGNSKLLARIGFDGYEIGSESSWYTKDSVWGVQAGFTF